MKKFHFPAMSGLAALAAMGRMAPMTATERARGRLLRAPDGHPDAVISPEQMADTLRKKIDEQHGEVLKKADEALAEAKKSGQLSAETKSSVDQQLTTINVMREQLAGIEQKMAGKQSSAEAKSYGKQIAESDEFKSFQSRGYSGNMRLAFKAVTAAAAATVSDRQLSDPLGLPRRTMTVRDLLDVVPTSSGSIDYARQTTRTNNAAPVAEGAAKPYSDYAWAIVNTPVRTIAHLAKITRQAMDDSVQLEGEVESEMRYGLKYVEEAEILNGDGTGQHLSGLITNATAFSAPITISSPTPIDNLRLALLQAELALFPSDGIVLSPQDWARIELTKDASAFYILSDPKSGAEARLWGKPVVPTPAMSIDKFLVGGFKLQRLYDRMEPEVLISSENADDFEKNLYTMRCEERVALAVRRPGALIYGDFGFVP